MKVHSNCGLDNFLDSRTRLNHIIFDFDWKQLSMHLNDGAASIIIREGFGIESCTRNYQF